MSGYLTAVKVSQPLCGTMTLADGILRTYDVLGAEESFRASWQRTGVHERTPDLRISGRTLKNNWGRDGTGRDELVTGRGRSGRSEPVRSHSSLPFAGAATAS